MSDRYVDKKIKILESISKGNFEAECVSNVGLRITDEELINIVEELQYSNLLKIQNIDSVGNPDELKDIPNGNDIIVYYRDTNKDKLTDLLERLIKNYPRRDKPIIREKTLTEISKHLSDAKTESEIIAILKKCGVAKTLTENQHVKWKKIFSALNYYALSTKREDFHMLTKIIQNLVHPAMFNGDKKEEQIAIDTFNNLLKYDAFIIKNGLLKRIKNSNDNDTATLIEKNGKPFLEPIGAKGYLKINKHSKGIFIGAIKTRKFRLLQALCEPHFGIHKNPEAIFEAIKLNRDKNNQRLNSSSLRRTEILTKIKFTMKEVRKITKKINLCSDNNDNVMWIELEG